MIRIKQAAHIHVYSTAPSSHPLPVVHSTAYCTSHPICQMSILKYEKFVCKKPSLLGSRGCESWCDCDVVVVLHIYVSVSVVWWWWWVVYIISVGITIVSVWVLFGWGQYGPGPGSGAVWMWWGGSPWSPHAAACQYTSSQHPSRPIFTTQFFCRPVAGEHFVPTGISIEWGSRGRVRVGCSC